MKRIALLMFLSCVFIASTWAQRTSEERNVGSFTGIKSCCGIDIYLRAGSSSTVKVEAHSELLKHVKTQVKNNVLSISVDNNNSNGWKDLFKDKKVIVYASVDELTLLEATSACDIKGEATLKGKDVKINVTSAASVNIDLRADNISCNATSGADIKMKGSARAAKLSATSGADIMMKDFVAEEVDASCTSGSDITITAGKKIKARATSGSDIVYYGNPSIKDVSSSSGGSVKGK